MGREWPSKGQKSKFCFPQDVIDPHIPLSQQSVRRIRRENTILEAVRMSKVIVDPSTLHKLIIDQERKEGGHDGSMDRKSLHRILRKLAMEGQTRNIIIKLTHPDSQKGKEMMFVCEPDVTDQHSIIQSAIEQAKMKFNIVPKHRDNLQKAKDGVAHIKSPLNVTDLSDTDCNLLTSESLQKIGFDSVDILKKDGNESILSAGKYDKKQGRKYGLQPKFI